MAKKSAIEKNKKRQKLVDKYAAKRAELKAVAMNEDLPLEERFKARLKLAELPRNSAPNRVRTDYVDEIEVWSDEESSTAIPSCVSQIQSWPKNEGTVNTPTGEFVQIVTSGEKGEWEYHEFEMENEFRPENLYPKYTDSERAIEGYEYQLGEGDWIDIEGELSQSRGSYVDIELMLGTESGEVYIDFEEIKDEMEEQDLNPEDENDVKEYFQNLIKL